MSDYLVNLAARVLRPQRNVRPRVASVFEPWSSDRSVDETDWNAEAAATSAGAPDQAGHAESAVDRRIQTARGSDAVDREPDAPTIEAIPPPEVRVSPPPASLATVADRADSVGELSARTSPLARDGAAASELGSAVVRYHDLPDVSHSIPSLSAGPVSAGPRVIESRTTIEARQSPTPTFIALSEPRPELVASVAAATAVRPVRTVVRNAGRLAGPPPDAQEAPVPAIHVSIGRVEVRASTAAPTSRPQTQATPSGMTLHEYLRQRSEAAR